MAILSNESAELGSSRNARSVGLAALTFALVLPDFLGRRLFADYFPFEGIERLRGAEARGPIYGHPK